MITSLTGGLNNLIAGAGQQFRVRYYSQTIGSVWDDDGNGTSTFLTQSGVDVWLSGIPFSLAGKMASEEVVLLQQGLINADDTKLYFSGGVVLTGSAFQVKIGLGSPQVATAQYSVIDLGIGTQKVEATPAYKVVYLRRLMTGSLLGE